MCCSFHNIALIQKCVSLEYWDCFDAAANIAPVYRTLLQQTSIACYQQQTILASLSAQQRHTNSDYQPGAFVLLYEAFNRTNTRAAFEAVRLDIRALPFLYNIYAFKALHGDYFIVSMLALLLSLLLCKLRVPSGCNSVSVSNNSSKAHNWKWVSLRKCPKLYECVYERVSLWFGCAVAAALSGELEAV